MTTETPGTPATAWPSPHLVRVAAEALYGGPLDPDPGSVDDVSACHNAKSAASVVLRVAADEVAAREAAAYARGRDEGRVERSEGFRRLLAAAGISGHEGGLGDTYYDRPAAHMLEELIAERDLYRGAMDEVRDAETLRSRMAGES